MKDFQELLANLSKIKDFAKICIGIASPEKIRSWSYGEVKTSETINYRTFKPESDGLFCPKIFGPSTSYECSCGKYKLHKHQGLVCEKCEVEVIRNSVRRQRMGHIELAYPIAHIWYFKSLPSRIALLLDISLPVLEQVIYFNAYIVINPGLTSLKCGQLLTKTGAVEAIKTYGNDLNIGIGSAAVYELLRTLNLTTEKLNLHKQIKNSNPEAQNKKFHKRLHLLDSFLNNNIRPEWMILKVLPVLPPDLRPLVALDEGRFANSDLNELYRRVLNRNNRAKHLLKLDIPEVMLQNELRLLQESVDALLDNGLRRQTGTNKLSLQSLSSRIKGKQSHFRQSLLGKRVDYSARSIIIPNPDLKLRQCGLPREMALELFKPFLLGYLQKQKLAISIKVGKEMLAQRTAKVWQALTEVIYQHPLLINYVPTLHRSNIQAFEPILTDTKVIQLHPLVCQVFNAKLAGERVAVHVPLSIESQLEAQILLNFDYNILSPTNGTPLVIPSEEILLGLSFMTHDHADACSTKMCFKDANEVQRAYANNLVDLSTQIEVQVKSQTTTLPKESTINYSDRQRVKTTVGRAILSQCLPEEIPYAMLNCHLTKHTLTKLIKHCYNTIGPAKTVNFVEQLTQFGFAYATRSGISQNLIDITRPIQSNTVLAKSLNVALKKGLDTHQYFIYVHETRKNLINNVLKTVNVSYITRRLVDSAQDVIITEQDCGTERGLTLATLTKRGEQIENLTERALGRVTATDIFTLTHQLIIKAGTLLDETWLKYLEQEGISKIKIRSPITCQSKQGICVCCYGHDLGRGQFVDIGDAVGIIAAQSIGESNTRLIMPQHNSVPQEQPEYLKVSDAMISLATQQNNFVEQNRSLLRIVELFEARIPKQTAILAPVTGIISFAKDTKTKVKLIITEADGNQIEIMIPKWRKINVVANQIVKLGYEIVIGEQNPHDILHLQGINALVDYFIREMQEVYTRHSIKINDKHFEVIVRQMLQMVTIQEPGDSEFMCEDTVLCKQVITENEFIANNQAEKKLAVYKPKLLGISKVSLITESFIATTGFVENTTQTLLTNALNKKCDKLQGLKENIITGRLVPVGTGLAYHKNSKNYKE